MAAAVTLSQQHPPTTLGSSVPITVPVMDRHDVRPTSALARGVRITEYTDTRVNPEPIVLEESELLLEEYLSPRKLRELTGMDDLDEVHYLEMRVDTRDTSLGNFGSHLPNLSQLKLSNSIIMTVRDIGSCLTNLRVLWLARCGVEDLDGLSSITNLRELFLAYNEVTDISPCSMLEHLQVLDLEGNNISDIAQVEFLTLCQSLTNLTLEGNPVCVTPRPDETAPDYDYRQAVKSCLTQLRILDDEPLLATPSGHERKTSTSVFDDDWRLIDELMQEGTINVSDDETIEPPNRPVTASIRPPTSYRPRSALKPYTNAGIRPPTRSNKRPGSSWRGSTASSGRSGYFTSTRPESSGSGGSRPGTSSKSEDIEETTTVDDGSDLTMGDVFCGNPSKALKSRLRTPSAASCRKASRLLAQQREHREEAPVDAEVSLEQSEELRGLMSDIKEWKQHHHKVVEEIDASKAPQVLTISHDDVLSDDASLSSDDEYSPHLPLTSPTRPKSGQKKRGVDYFRPASASGARPKSRHSLRSASSVEEEDCPPSTSSSLPSPHEADRGHLHDNGRLTSPARQHRVIHRTSPDKTDQTSSGVRPIISPEDHDSRFIPAPPSHTKIRKGQLANVQLLPSKFSK